MILKAKAIPIDARKAMGFRGKIERSCFYCGATDENNFDAFGKLHQLKVVSLDKNLNNSKTGNHIFTCARCRGSL